MKELKGRFYYRLTANGNMTGEFSNNLSIHSQPESAERIPQNNVTVDSPFSFLGAYHSTWFEPADGVPVLARLEITQKLGTYQIFSVRWLNSTSHAVLFLGEAMIGEGLLIGNYWQP